jgi:hypothetical protein
MKQGNEFILKERKNISFQNWELIKKITSIPFEKLVNTWMLQLKKTYDSQKEKLNGFCSHFPTCNSLLKKLENISSLVGGGTTNFFNKLDVDPLLVTSPTSFKKVALSLDSIQIT